MNDLAFAEPPSACASELVDGESNCLNFDPSWRSSGTAIGGLCVGKLVGMHSDGLTPLVVFPGQPGTAAVIARTTIDLHGIHVGRDVVLMFQDGDFRKPIVLGCLFQSEDLLPAKSAHVEVDADGERLVVSAKEQLVLRCGEASITLTKSGKVLIQGAYVSSRSSGVNRIKGGSVQIN